MKIDFNYDGRFINVHKTDTYGGVTINIYPGYEMLEMMKWWLEWQEIMKSQHPTVKDAVNQLKVLWELSGQHNIPAVSVGP